MNRVVRFEINADMPERAVKFYSEVFGWKIEKWDGPMDYWLVYTGEGPGIDGGIARRDSPSRTTVNTISVPSIDEFLSKVEEGGGKVVMQKTALPGIGWFAACQDTEGNAFALMQEDRSAV
jgi:predicted enzyme related to lactoylglutathione lyase